MPVDVRLELGELLLPVQREASKNANDTGQEVLSLVRGAPRGEPDTDVGMIALGAIKKK